MANRCCTSGSPVWISAFSHWLHRSDTCTSCQVSARFRPRTRLTRQLCTRSTPFQFNFADCISVPLRSDGRKLARQSGHKSCAPRKMVANAASISPLRGSRRRTLAALRVRLMSNRREHEAAKIQGGRDAPHIGQTAIWPRDYVRPASNSPRVVARGQGISNMARGSACRRGQAIGRKASPRPRHQQ